MRPSSWLALSVGAVVAFGVGCAPDATETGPVALADGQVVEVSMIEMAFEPDDYTVPVGATVTFRFSNDGQVVHEAVIADEAGQREHGVTNPGDPPKNGNLVIDPGEVGDITYTFDTAGELLIGCHIPGHYEAGMVGTILVE
jgi:uncharacterized cupredoxin-like copper-binding protein